jgi:NADH-quinone oxidoreductase subunit G
MPIAKVNGVEVEFEPGMTVLQVAELAGEEIPRFCYHERLSIAGNCRMCLVEVKPGPPKPQASCALPAAENQEIFTNTPMVEKARKGVMEFLLINHPLDCPICDQGGECDLQDQAIGYGRDDTRYHENKRAVEEKYMGPVIKTEMTRCIQCTRCVRFITEVAGIPEIGLISRGEDVEITTYLESAVTSELSGNVNDLCPVGALTHKPWAFNYRPWELKKTDSIDVMDALGSAIRVDARGNEVMRVLPRTNEDVNEEWLSDKSRYAVDGLLRQRLDQPYIRVGDKLQAATWNEALDLVAAKINATTPDKIGVIAGDLADVETLKAAKDLFTALGSANIDCRQDGAQLGGVRESYLFNATIAGIDEADAILIIGANPRLDAPVLNARIQRGWRYRNIAVGVVGPMVDLTYDYDHLGTNPSAISALSKAKKGFMEAFRAAKKPMVIVGSGAYARADGAAVLAEAAKIAKASNASWNVLHSAAGRVGGLDVGFTPGEGGLSATQMASKGALDVMVLLGADEIKVSKSKAFKVYIGTHGDAGAHGADVILPGAAYTEKNGIYVNTEGRVQRAFRAVFPKGEAKEDWSILRALSSRVGQTLPYDTHEQLRQKLFADHPVLAGFDFAPGKVDWNPGSMSGAGKTDETPLGATTDFYMTNPIARASVTMAELSALKSGASKMAAE